MSKKIAFSFLTVLFLTSFFACSTHEIGPSYAPQSFSFWVDAGVKYNGSVNYSFYSDTAHAFTGTFYTGNFTDNYLTIRLADTSGIALRTYPVGYDSVAHTNLKLCYYSNDAHPYSGTGGSLTITLLDTVTHTLSGTFSFTGNYAGYTRHITYGMLENINYTKLH